MKRLYIVEDNEHIRQAVSEYFTINDYEVIEFPGVSGVLEAISHKPPDILILDIMLPDGNGYVLAKKIRSSFQYPILFLTAKEDESDRVMGFEVGGDDYVVKPFSNKELYLRVEAILKRYMGSGNTFPRRGIWRVGDSQLIIDDISHKAFLNGKIIYLTNAEWNILCFMAYRTDQALSREQLLGECLGYFYEGSERTIDSHIANLRSTLEGEEWIETIYGFGYRFQGIPESQSQQQ